MYPAESTRQQSASQVTLELWVLSMKFASFHPSGTWNLEVVPTVLENLLT
jgi:hypothetical protein